MKLLLKAKVITAVIDLDKSKLVAILQNGHKKNYRNSDCGVEVLEQIEEVSIDLWSPYKSLVGN